MGQQTVSINLKSEQAQKFAKQELMNLGWVQQPVTNGYVAWRLTGDGCVAMLYTSGKLVIQGIDAELVAQRVSGDVVQEREFEPHIGVDEVGKGDYFGALVVVAAYISKEDFLKLHKMGVDDSKKLTDVRIQSIGEQLSKVLLYEQITIAPSEYNDIFSLLGNVSVILARKHSEAVKKLYARVAAQGLECKYAVFDQFSKRKSRLEDAMSDLKELKVVQFHKGEEDIAVAAASILARYHFLEYWGQMEQKYSFAFPKGSSEVLDAGREFVEQFGQEKLKDVAKVSFKTTKRILTLF
jgi:ribonuclease HIII